MTLESILKMDARERDALIAQRLFNRRIADTAQAVKDGCDGTPPYEWHMAGIYGPARCEVPHYSTDVKADYAVLCHVREKWAPEQHERFEWFLMRVLGLHKNEENHITLDRAGLGLILDYQPGDFSIAALVVAHETEAAALAAGKGKR